MRLVGKDENVHKEMTQAKSNQSCVILHKCHRSLYKKNLHPTNGSSERRMYKFCASAYGTIRRIYTAVSK